MEIVEPVFRMSLRVPAGAVDVNRHANNVAYVQWMQDAAVQHSRTTGGTRVALELGATWVVRMHRIEYLAPAFADEAITVLTWVADLRKVRSLRRYRFIRDQDQAVLAKAETEWVFVDAATGRPRTIPPELRIRFITISGELDAAAPGG